MIIFSLKKKYYGYFYPVYCAEGYLTCVHFEVNES